MMRNLLTPSKVTAWLACEHSMTLQGMMDSGELERPASGMDAFSQLVMDKGDQHEAACLADYEARGIVVHRVPQRHPQELFEDWVDRVADCLTAGHQVLSQMPFVHDGMRGIADFLERVEDEDGLATYEPVDAKLTRVEAKPGHVLQLSFYADAIEAALGVLPENLHVWLGSGQRETVRTREVRAYWHRLRSRLAEAGATTGGETRPSPNPHCDYCQFAALCEQTWRAEDALHYVAGIRTSDRTALTDGGVETLADLASLDGEAVEGMDPVRLLRLRDQAALQVRARELAEAPPPFEQIAPGESPPWGHGHALLPRPDDGDVFLDFEGHPLWRADGGLFFLFGFLARDERGEWAYTERWAHDLDEERDAARWLVDTLYERFERHPEAHVYHYNHTERSGLQALFAKHSLDDARLGTMIREGAFVDLLEVVRNAVQIGAESYSLKEVERLTSFERRDDITKGSGAVVEYDTFMARTDDAERAGQTAVSDPVLARIAAYNEDDVRATMAVRDWLVEVRPDDAPWRPARLDEVVVDEGADAIVAALRELGAPADLLLADLLGFWAREGRAHNAQLRARAEAPVEHLIEDEAAIGGIYSVTEVPRLTPTGKVAKHPGLELRFPPQPVAGFRRAMYLNEDGSPGYCTLHEAVPSEGRVVVELQPDGRERGDVPRGLVANDWVDPGLKRGVLAAWAEAAVAAGGVQSLDDARSQLLTRAATRFVDGGGPPDGRFGDNLDDLARWVTGLDRSWLAVQGPPGTGKTYRAARTIRHLVRHGHRVGITAMSHAAIHNLVAATHDAFAETDELQLLSAVVKREHEPPVDLDGVTYTKKPADCAADGFNVVAGTTWLFANDAMQANPVDVLVVDEAGQLALVDVVVAGASARDLVLLGDPQQLPQVNLAVHPGGSGASALEHVLAGRKTLLPEQGVFLRETRRMHPDVCDFIGEQFYEGRLSSHTSCDDQTTHLGTGLRWLRADHAGCSTRSPQEVEIVIEEIRRVVGGEWTDQHGHGRPLEPADVMVVTPYNNQKDLFRRSLDDAGLGDVRVGTVDRFQGQEAPVVFYSAATSSAEDAPRGLGFVFSRNRFNVAISRARCLAYLVSTPDVLDATAGTIDEMRTLSSACAFAAAAT